LGKTDGATVGQTITLSVLEFDVLWEHLQLGAFPPILDVNSHGATLEERAELTKEAWESLADKELGWPGQVDRRVAFRLKQLARPEWELDARLRLTAGPGTRALIVANASTATVAVLDEEWLTLRTAPADVLTKEAYALLPEHPPAGGRSITLPAAALDRATRTSTSEEFGSALTGAGLARSDALTLTMLASTAIRFAHFGAARTRRYKPRRRADRVISVYDTPHGRYLVKASGQWVTLASGTAAAIIRQLDELLVSL
jgi:hypothetical protein